MGLGAAELEKLGARGTGGGSGEGGEAGAARWGWVLRGVEGDEGAARLMAG